MGNRRRIDRIERRPLGMAHDFTLKASIAVVFLIAMALALPLLFAL
jgi:hypothetical protein